MSRAGTSRVRPSAVKVRALDDSHTGAWDDFVRHSPGSSLYHLSGWREVITGSFGHRTYYLYTESDGISGVLPLVHLKSRLFGSYLVSLPYFNYGGICTDDAYSAEKLLEEAIKVARGCGAEHIELRETERLGVELPVKTSKVSMMLELPSTTDELWKAIPSKLRSQIRRPEKEGMEARIGGIELIDDFYSVFALNMRDLGTPVYPRDFFRRIMERFHDATRISAVYYRGAPVAAGFLAGFRDTLEIPWASSAREFNRFSPNMLLYWKSLEYAIEGGFRRFDFGRSSPDSGTFRFKKQWGASPVQLYWHYWLKDGGPLPEINPSNPKFRLFIGLWKNLPVRVANLIGPSIVKNLP